MPQALPDMAAVGRATRPLVRPSQALHRRTRRIATELIERLNECREREAQLVVIEVLDYPAVRVGWNVHEG